MHFQWHKVFIKKVGDSEIYSSSESSGDEFWHSLLDIWMKDSNYIKWFEYNPTNRNKHVN